MGALTTGAATVALLLWWWLGGVLLLAVGIVGLLVGGWALLDRRVKLRVDEVGLWSARWGTTVHWGEIDSIETRTFRGVEQACVIPKEPARVLERMPPWCRLASWMTERSWGSRFVLSTTSLEGGTPALLAVLRRYLGVRSGPSR